MAFSMSIFKAYDIRGTLPQQLNEEVAYTFGRAFVVFTKAKTVMVCMDMRESSPLLKKGLIQGLTDQGADVIDVGLTSTPMCYFSCAYLGTEASIMVTASHNPKEYNGFKLTREQAIPISGDTGIKEIEKLFHKGDTYADILRYS